MIKESTILIKKFTYEMKEISKLIFLHISTVIKIVYLTKASKANCTPASSTKQKETIK